MRKSLNKLLLSVVVMLSVNCLAGSGGDDSGRTPSSRKNANTVNGLFYLIDYQTQTPVVRCRVPGGWFAGGKATWSQNPAQPVTWYVWIMSPESEIKTAVASPCVIGMPGTIRQVPLLHDPRILANNFLPAVQKDYNLSGVVLIESCFRDVGDAEKNQLLAARRRQSAQRGIQLTGCFLREFFARYEGEGGEKRRTVILSIPVMALESRISLSQVVTVEFLSLFSFCCRKGDELKAQTCLEEMIKSVQPNPNFIALVNRISNQRTASWVSAQIQIRNQQMEAYQRAASSSSDTQEKVADMWSEYIRAVDSVSNPNTGEKMFVDRRYDHAWINSDNEIIYCNSGFNTSNSSTAVFDPNSNALFNSRSWSRLK